MGGEPFGSVMGASIGGMGGGPFGCGMGATFGGGMGAPMGGFMSYTIAHILPSSGSFGGSSSGVMSSYIYNEEVAQDGEDNGGEDEA
jgi:hypothetical protein